MEASEQGSQQTSQEVKPFRFMDLSPELRNNIYSLLLENGKPLVPVAVARHRHGLPFAQRGHTVQINILRACRQVKDEATSILYGCNTFIGVCDGSLQAFLYGIGRNVEQVRHLKLEFVLLGDKIKLRKALDLLKSAKSIQVLSIDGDYGLVFSADRFAKEIGPIMRALHKARQKLKEYSMKSILDVVVIEPYPFAMESEKKQIKEFEERFKKLVGATLK